MFKSIFNLTLICGLLTFSQVTFAKPNFPLVSSDNQIVLFDLIGQVKTPHYKKIRRQIQAVAFAQAQIWGDTILEGDYASEGNTRVDAVVALYQGNKLQGYRITYSERAWQTADCNFEGQNFASRASCIEGRITESSYVTADFQKMERDYDHLAEFFEN